MKISPFKQAKPMLFAITLFCLCLPAQAGSPTPILDNTTANKQFVVRVYSQLTPIDINQMHHWIIHIATPSGEAVSDAKLKVDGGMPDHNHGLPTAPQITKNLGNGDYLLEGVKFHMNGWWQMYVSIQADGIEDSITFDLNL